MSKLFVPLTLLLGLAISLALRRPPVNPKPDPNQSMEATLQPPPAVAKMLRRACYDCHSSETRWPWYIRVPVLGSLIESDVRKGRAAFNFSDWAVGPCRKPRTGAAMLLGMCAAIRAGQMPRKNYQWMHPDAKPSPSEIEEFCDWGRSQARRATKASKRDSAESAQQIPQLQRMRIALKAN